MTTRSAEDVLARARVASLVAALANGTPVELLRPELQRHGLGIHLTEVEAAWLWADEVPDAEPSSQLEAMRALAWALGLLSSLGAPDPEACAAVQDALDDPSLGELVLRDENELRAMLRSIEQAIAEGEAPPNERVDRERLVWRRRALRWALGEQAAWGE